MSGINTGVNNIISCPKGTNNQIWTRCVCVCVRKLCSKLPPTSQQSQQTLMQLSVLWGGSWIYYYTHKSTNQSYTHYSLCYTDKETRSHLGGTKWSLCLCFTLTHTQKPDLMFMVTKCINGALIREPNRWPIHYTVTMSKAFIFLILLSMFQCLI